MEMQESQETPTKMSFKPALVSNKPEKLSNKPVLVSFKPEKVSFKPAFRCKPLLPVALPAR